MLKITKSFPNRPQLSVVHDKIENTMFYFTNVVYELAPFTF